MFDVLACNLMCVCVFVPVSIDYVCFEAATLLFCSCSSSILFEKLFQVSRCSTKWKIILLHLQQQFFLYISQLQLRNFLLQLQQLVRFNIVHDCFLKLLVLRILLLIFTSSLLHVLPERVRKRQDTVFFRTRKKWNGRMRSYLINMKEKQSKANTEAFKIN